MIYMIFEYVWFTNHIFSKASRIVQAVGIFQAELPTKTHWGSSIDVGNWLIFG